MGKWQSTADLGIAGILERLPNSGGVWAPMGHARFSSALSGAQEFAPFPPITLRAKAGECSQIELQAVDESA